MAEGMHQWFSDTFDEARRRFCAAAERAGAELERLRVDGLGEGGAPLSIDVAWLGPPEPRGVLLVTSGIHGVEGYGGSAVQEYLLASGARPAAGVAWLFCHALNPYGMVHGRRWNAANVDLNRNHLAPGEAYEDSNHHYAAMAQLLNPPRFSSGHGWLWGLAAHTLRHGSRAVRQGIAEGQYTWARGLFFGGHELQLEARAVRECLLRRLQGVGHWVHIDFHSGLGRPGRSMLLVHAPPGSARFLEAQRAFGGCVRAAMAGPGYHIRGGLGDALASQLSACRTTTVAFEYGTCSPLTLLSALRAENSLHHYGDPSSEQGRRVKRWLWECFSPRSPSWRAGYVQQGARVVLRGDKHLASTHASQHLEWPSQ